MAKSKSVKSKSSSKRNKSKQGKSKTKMKKTKSKKNRIGSEPSATYSEKSEGPMGWNNTEKLQTNVPTTVTDRTQQEKRKSQAAHSNAGGEQTSNDISLKLSAQISRIRKKRKQKILKYWNTVLEAINEVERDRRTRKKPQLEDEAGVPPMMDTTVTDTEHKDDEEDDDENPWEATNINKTSSFNEWLLKARATLPSVKGEVQSRDPFKGTTILDGKYYRQFKAAKNRVYAKCALTDDDAQTECDYDEHLKEVVITGSSSTEYRKKFNYFEELEIIKSFPVSLNKKRLMYRYLNAEATQFQKTQKGCRCKLRCYPCCYCLFLHVSKIVYAIAPALMLWKVPIQNMYAYFGVEVLYYFLWLRKIFLIQLFYVFITVGIKVVPAYYTHGRQFQDEYLIKIGMVQPFTPSDFLHGGGWFQTSFAFYGGYPHAREINHEKGANTFRNGAYRLLLLWLTLLLSNTLIIVLRIFFYRHRQLSASRSGGGETLSYFNTIFCSWEFSVNSVQLSASVQQAISKEFTLLNSHLTGDAHKAYNYNDKGRTFKRYITKVPYGPQIYHFFVHIVTIAITILTSVLAFEMESFLNDKRDDLPCAKATRFEFKEVKYFWVRGCYFSFLFNIVSPFIVYLSDVELWYKRRYRNYVVIGRLSFMYIGNYIALVAFWWSTSTAWDSNGLCYENAMCEAFYQVLIWEFIITTIYWIVKDVLLNFIIWKCSKTYTAPELSMDIMVVSLIFRHALLSMVVQFAPLLSPISLIANWITFYVKKTILYWIYSHPKYFVHVSDFELPYFMCYYFFFIVQTFCSLHLLFSGTIYVMKKWGDAYKTTLETKKQHLHLEKRDRILLLRAIYNCSKAADGDETGENDNDKEMTTESDKEAEVVHLTLDKRNIFKAKVRTLAALIVGGKVHELSGKYKQIQALRQQLLDDFEAQTPPEETPNQRKARLYDLKQELASEVLTPTKREVEARRQSMAARMMMNTESIKLIHKQEFQQRQRRWNEDKNPKNK